MNSLNTSATCECRQHNAKGVHVLHQNGQHGDDIIGISPFPKQIELHQDLRLCPRCEELRVDSSRHQLGTEHLCRINELPTVFFSRNLRHDPTTLGWLLALEGNETPWNLDPRGDVSEKRSEHQLETTRRKITRGQSSQATRTRSRLHYVRHPRWVHKNAATCTQTST